MRQKSKIRATIGWSCVGGQNWVYPFVCRWIDNSKRWAKNGGKQASKNVEEVTLIGTTADV